MANRVSHREPIHQVPQGPAGGPSPGLDELAGAAAVRRARQAGAGAGALAPGRRDADAAARVNVSTLDIIIITPALQFVDENARRSIPDPIPEDILSTE